MYSLQFRYKISPVSDPRAYKDEGIVLPHQSEDKTPVQSSLFNLDTDDKATAD